MTIIGARRYRASSIGIAIIANTIAVNIGAGIANISRAIIIVIFLAWVHIVRTIVLDIRIAIIIIIGFIARAEIGWIVRAKVAGIG